MYFSGEDEANDVSEVAEDMDEDEYKKEGSYICCIHWSCRYYFVVMYFFLVDLLCTRILISFMYKVILLRICFPFICLKYVRSCIL